MSSADRLAMYTRWLLSPWKVLALVSQSIIEWGSHLSDPEISQSGEQGQGQTEAQVELEWTIVCLDVSECLHARVFHNFFFFFCLVGC